MRKKLFLMSSGFLLCFLLAGFNDSPQTERIKPKLTSGVHFLLKQQNADGSIYQQNSPIFKVWETANALVAVHTVQSNSSPAKEKMLSFLLSARRQDGSFYHTISFAEQEFCIETTAVGLLALWLGGKKQETQKGASFLLHKQSPSGSWEIGTPAIKRDRFFPSVTGYALSTLALLELSPDNDNKGIDFILDSQQSDGSWGSSPVYYGTPYYSIRANLLTLKLHNQQESTSYQKAIQYVLDNQNQDGSWGPPGSPRPSRALRTTLAINSLLIHPNKQCLPAIQAGVFWLIQEQKEAGNWDGGFFVENFHKKEDVFTTAMAILALKRYMHYMSHQEPLVLNE